MIQKRAQIHAQFVVLFGEALGTKLFKITMERSDTLLDLHKLKERESLR